MTSSCDETSAVLRWRNSRIGSNSKMRSENQTSSFYFKVQLFNIHKAPMFYSLKSGEISQRLVSLSGRCLRV